MATRAEEHHATYKIVQCEESITFAAQSEIFHCNTTLLCVSTCRYRLQALIDFYVMFFSTHTWQRNNNCLIFFFYCPKYKSFETVHNSEEKARHFSIVVQNRLDFCHILVSSCLFFLSTFICTALLACLWFECIEHNKKNTKQSQANFFVLLKSVWFRPLFSTM